MTAKATAADVREMADRLISTLDSTMPPEQADAIVRDVAKEMYTDILGIKGEIIIDTSQPVARMHGGFGKNGARGVMTLAKYKFLEIDLHE